MANDDVDRAITEVAALIVQPTITTNFSYGNVRAWSFGEAATTTNGYYLELHTSIDGANTHGVRLSKYVAGTFYTLGGLALGSSLLANTPYHIKLRVEDVPAVGTTARKVEIGMKLWTGAITDEPATFSTFTDTATLPDIGGWTGPGLFGNTDRFFYSFRMATGGGSAPTSAPVTADAIGTLPKLTGTSDATVTAPPAFTADATGTLPKLTGTSEATVVTTAVTTLVPDAGTVPAGFTVFGAADAGLALASNDADTSYVENSGKTTGSFFVSLTDPPADFVKAISATLRITLKRG